MSGYVYKIEIPEKSNMSAADSMPSDFAEERAKRDPQPGDTWQEMFSYWVHVCERKDDRVHVREYSPPCNITPEEAEEDYWCTLTEFLEKVEYVKFDGNRRWVAEAGGALDEFNPLKDK